MPQVRLTQETCLKHFDRVTDNLPANADDWPGAARQNHLARFGAGVLPSNLNTLIILTSEAWERIISGTYLYCNPLPEILPDTLHVTISAGDIARVITTRKDEDEYKIVSDVSGSGIRDIRFLCRLNAQTQDYDIVHMHN